MKITVDSDRLSLIAYKELISLKTPEQVKQFYQEWNEVWLTRARTERALKRGKKLFDRLRISKN